MYTKLACLFFLCVAGLYSQTCIVNKINGDPLYKPVWSGTCVDSMASGKGLLYDYMKNMRYTGEMKNGNPHGPGTYYDHYIIEGNWANGIPVNAKYYLREIRFSEDYYTIFIENGYRYKLNEDKGQSPENLVMPSRNDSTGFSASLFNDTTYMPFTTKKRKMKKMPPPDFYSSRIFFVGTYVKGGIFVSVNYTRYLVKCKEKGLFVLYEKTRYPKKGIIETVWLTETETPYVKLYTDPFSAIKSICTCN